MEPDREKVEAAVDVCWERACGIFPGILVDRERFCAFVLERLHHTGDPAEALHSLHTDDLYLACACLEDDERAQRRFMEICLPVVRSALSRIEPTGSLDDEVMQGLLEKLLTAPAEGAPRLAQYNGRSALRVWVRVAAVRQALNLRRSVHRERPLDEGLLAGLVAEDNQEIAYFKQLYRDAFKDAFHRVIERLDQRERNLLQLQLVEELSLEQMGVIYGVNRSTVSRWMKALRAKLQQETRSSLKERLDMADQEIESVLKLVVSRFDLSLARALDDQGSG